MGDIEQRTLELESTASRRPTLANLGDAMIKTFDLGIDPKVLDADESVEVPYIDLEAPFDPNAAWPRADTVDEDSAVVPEVGLSGSRLISGPETVTTATEEIPFAPRVTADLSEVIPGSRFSRWRTGIRTAAADFREGIRERFNRPPLMYRNQIAIWTLGAVAVPALAWQLSTQEGVDSSSAELVPSGDHVASVPKELAVNSSAAHDSASNPTATETIASIASESMGISEELLDDRIWSLVDSSEFVYFHGQRIRGEKRGDDAQLKLVVLDENGQRIDDPAAAAERLEELLTPQALIDGIAIS